MFTILKGGCDARHPSTYRLSRPEGMGLSNYVLLIVKTAGEFDINGNHYSVSSGQAIIFSPYSSCYYGNPKGEYIDDWLHFDFDSHTAFEQICPITDVPFKIGQTDGYTLLIKQILWEFSYGHPDYAQTNIDALFTVLFNHLRVAYEHQNSLKLITPIHNQLQLLRLDLQNSFDQPHRIEEHAEQMGLSPSYFQHLYTEFFGISFQKDLIQMRIEHAKYLLSTTDLTIEQIAEACGYSNEVHFYRQFKKYTGMTPAQSRKI